MRISGLGITWALSDEEICCMNLGIGGIDSTSWVVLHDCEGRQLNDSPDGLERTQKQIAECTTWSINIATSATLLVFCSQTSLHPQRQQSDMHPRRNWIGTMRQWLHLESPMYKVTDNSFHNLAKLLHHKWPKKRSNTPNTYEPFVQISICENPQCLKAPCKECMFSLDALGLLVIDQLCRAHRAPFTPIIKFCLHSTSDHWKRSEYDDVGKITNAS